MRVRRLPFIEANFNFTFNQQCNILSNRYTSSFFTFVIKMLEALCKKTSLTLAFDMQSVSLYQYSSSVSSFVFAVVKNFSRALYSITLA